MAGEHVPFPASQRNVGTVEQIPSPEPPKSSTNRKLTSGSRLLQRCYVPPSLCGRRSSAEFSMSSHALESRGLQSLLPTPQKIRHYSTQLCPWGWRTVDRQPRESRLVQGPAARRVVRPPFSGKWISAFRGMDRHRVLGDGTNSDPTAKEVPPHVFLPRDAPNRVRKLW